MLFNSPEFLLLFLITFGLYYLPWMGGQQVRILVLSSLVFYSWESPALLILLLCSAATNILTSYFVIYGAPHRRKALAIGGVIFNLCVLAFFKYSPLISRSLFPPTSSIGEFLLQIPLPIGISFFTFEGISLVVDVYKENYFKGDRVVSRSLLDHAQRTLFFISFFPHLISGPILKAHEFLPQIDRKRFADIFWERSVRYLIVGYFLKMVIADNLKDHTFWIQYPYFQGMSTPALAVMLLGYSCQIFADFAGYSLIAIGLAKLFGYDFIQNFNFPYISGTFSEFWQRWHISLSSFLKEYLYIPLGGNRRGQVRTYLNLMITMFLGGLWHGAAWSYAIWGTTHGGALAIERFAKDRWPMRPRTWLKPFRMLLVFLVVTLAWLLFKLPRFQDVIAYFQAMHDNVHRGMETNLIGFVLIYSFPVFVYHAAYLWRSTALVQRLRRWDALWFGGLFFLILVNSGSSGAFIYFQF